MNIKFKKMVAFLGAGLMIANVAHAQNPPPFVQVKAYMQCYGGYFVYHYKVINNQARAEIDSFAIGRKSFDLGGLDERPEFTVEPVVVNEKYKITAPSGWIGHGGGGENFPGYLTIEWGIEDAADGYADFTKFIGPRQTLAGFSVTLDRKDPTYLNSHFTVRLSYGSSFTGLIEFDPTEPSLCP